MNTPTTPPITTTGKVIISLLAALSALRLYEFFMYGYALASLLGAAAMALLAYGAYQNRFGKRPIKIGTYATGAGIILMIAAVAMRFI